MDASEKLCLQWNDFKENITSSFRELRKDRDFTDITLACEDGSQIEAHKVVLASSSPFFMELLKKNRHQHPLLYMRGLKSEALLVGAKKAIHDRGGYGAYVPSQHESPKSKLQVRTDWKAKYLK